MNKEALYLVAELMGQSKDDPTKLDAVRALYFAVQAHMGQKRRDGTDYIDHPVGATRLYMNLGGSDTQTITDIILHDTGEQGKLNGRPVTRDDVTSRFGEETADDVWAMTKEEGYNNPTYFGHIRRKIRRIIAKACDRAHNVSNMVNTYTADELERYCEETEIYYFPMMKDARRDYPEHSRMFIVFRDFMKGIIACVKRVVKLERENEGLKQQVGELTQSVGEYQSQQSHLQSALEGATKDKNVLQERFDVLMAEHSQRGDELGRLLALHSECERDLGSTILEHNNLCGEHKELDKELKRANRTIMALEKRLGVAKTSRESKGRKG